MESYEVPHRRYRSGVYDESARERDPNLDEAPTDEPDPRLRCIACEVEITSLSQLFGKDGEPPDRVFFNPAGLVMKLLTVRRATNLRLVGSPTDEFSWFPGWTWRIALCAGCGGQLGWLFEALGDGEPPSFWGLLRERLVQK